ncbi:sugar phosphate isomerase/epimerase family protein [Calycomorphotria hydatis]|uniref:Xylose isomerase-like TIM barrel n=1 Tax=Calycomorphotria hydatis TaxID=2528027 RepID=A0A517T4S8_9PLAN|nr:TIM barrel protein [Calycomorphotria hydatis]QDT63368.1 Xylose isomerase-like TIM barrel [Calycomorphotria hydatis]
MAIHRRDFLSNSALLAASTAFLGSGSQLLADHHESHGEGGKSIKPLFEISLAEWSLHTALRANEFTNLDFPRITKEEFSISAVEYVNQFFKDKAKDADYLKELDTRCKDNGVKSVLIMVDGEGNLGEPAENKRRAAVENHFKWVEAAKTLGCHSIRVNARSQGSFTDQLNLAADGLRQLCEFADDHEINVIVENHGGLSSNGAWLAAVMELTDHPRVGTLPDFGNFWITRPNAKKNITGEQYDRYKGVAQLMPYAKGVSAKSHDFDNKGNETATEYNRMLGLVTGWGYDGYIGIEYEGKKLGEFEGIKATKKLLERVRDDLTGHHHH